MSREPIAIIGIGCRLPGNINTPKVFWERLKIGYDAITEVPANRWDLTRFYDPDPVAPGKMYTRWGGFLEHTDQFDARFFGVSRREAMSMDPQQRLFLEISWEAMEDAGYPPSQLQGSRTGVFAGVAALDFADIQLASENGENINAYSIMGTIANMIPGRVAAMFGFTGPNLAVDTGCSASLVAVHLACLSLWQGDCDQALAGGVSVILVPETTIGICKAFMLSADGRCKSFDAQADGYVRSEGAGIVFLKPLAAALRDQDPIYAIIRASAVNQDGLKKQGIGVPNGLAQQAVMKAAYQQAGILPQQIGYIEAHGTGTIVGDPIEANAIGSVIGAERPLSLPPCFIGSVKTNLGHTEAAAGITSLIKTALVVKHGQIPPNLHFHVANPQIDFAACRLVAPQKLEHWPLNPSLGRFAGVNSFGVSGTNVHVVLESWDRPIVNSTHEVPIVAEIDPPFIFTVSARTSSALHMFVERYVEFLTDDVVSADAPSLYDICYTSCLHREHHSQRLILLVATKFELKNKLIHFLAGHQDNQTESSSYAEALDLLIQNYTTRQPVDWAIYYPRRGQLVTLPHYPWERQRYWEKSKHNSLSLKGSKQKLLEQVEEVFREWSQNNLEEGSVVWANLAKLPTEESKNQYLKQYLYKQISELLANV